MSPVQTADLQSRCDLLRSLHRPGAPLLLPNAWDVATARAVVAAGFPVVATTSGGVAGSLGYEDHEGAPADEMLAAAARITRAVEAPVTVDAEAGYGLVINARVDVFLSPALAGAAPRTQEKLVPDALRRANAYLEAGVDCVYPILLWETDALRRFAAEVSGPWNVVRLPQTPSLDELAALGVARVSCGPLLYRGAMARFEDQLASLQERGPGTPQRVG
jgi:2-methylisocitrate lyase-like PEP mutase family enzyme